ncbi:putative DD41D transposase [Trichonephila clavipes]|uniref:Putative DD41D transposase n=1 Tax=Trichonephila clavipes TaxID=2585209 RepID=A0A8X6SP85_TRICX|nr:putative DD41D transposase [Trichonephila clavipes]
MITNFFIPELNNHDVQELWFQQDGATCHTARATIDLLKDTFGDRLISRFGPVNWPPRSCDLTPLDYFLWGYVKSLVYAENGQLPCRTIMRHVKDPLWACLAWVLNKTKFFTTVTHRQSSGASLWERNWESHTHKIACGDRYST